MHFALIGPHPDGSNLARGLASGGHLHLAAVCDTALPEFAPEVRICTDLEELLADPQIELVIVAGSLGGRGEQLRRALQSERHVVCVHPCDAKPDRAYEAAWIRDEVKKVLLPALPAALHPAYDRLDSLIRSGHFGPAGASLIQWSGPRAADESGVAFPGWGALRRMGGEIVEVSGFAATEEMAPGQPLLFNGRFELGGLFQVTLLPAAEVGSVQCKLTSPAADAELNGPDDRGAARLRWRFSGEAWEEQSWNEWDRWAELAEIVEAAVTRPEEKPRLSWQDEIRALELDDALERSVEKRRSSDLEYQEVSADVGSKGTLTLIGCGVIWLILLIFGLSIWVPGIRWAVVPLLVGFLALLAMKWVAGTGKK